MSPQTINAYYTTLNNSFNICAGWICSSGYDVTMSYEEKLALIGVTAAHEISHCFSAIGVDGTVTAKWSQKDQDALLKKLNALGNYYSTFEMFPEIYCDGEVCKSEIGADFFGLSNILLIAKNSPDFDYELFFTTY